VSPEETPIQMEGGMKEYMMRMQKPGAYAGSTENGKCFLVGCPEEVTPEMVASLPDGDFVICTHRVFDILKESGEENGHQDIEFF